MKERRQSPHIQNSEIIHACLAGTLVGIGIGSVIAINTPILFGSGIVVLGIHESTKALKRINERRIIKI